MMLNKEEIIKLRKGQKPEVLEDIKGSTHLELDHGEDYKGWYLTKTPLEKKKLPLGFKDLEFEYPVSDYNFKFIMPPLISFNKGTIYYSDAERLFGVFRFPTNDKGEYNTPINLDVKKMVNELSQEQLENLMKKKSVLTFEAYKIARFGFHFFDLSDIDFNKIYEIIGSDNMKELRKRYTNELSSRIEEIKERIKGIPNYLLIMRNVLNRDLDFKEVSSLTNDVIRNGI